MPVYRSIRLLTVILFSVLFVSYIRILELTENNFRKCNNSDGGNNSNNGFHTTPYSRIIRRRRVRWCYCGTQKKNINNNNLNISVYNRGDASIFELWRRRSRRILRFRPFVMRCIFLSKKRRTPTYILVHVRTRPHYRPNKDNGIRIKRARGGVRAFVITAKPNGDTREEKNNLEPHMKAINSILLLKIK